MLNKICTDLETSKNLKELGIEMDTYHHWHKDQYDNPDLPAYLIASMNPYSNAHADITKAYTLEQILEMLPQYIEDNVLAGDKKDPCHFLMRKNILYYINAGCKFRDTRHFTTSKNTNQNLATTAARLLIKLIEDKIITNPNNKDSDE